MLVFCNCGSDKVDIKQWQSGRAQLQCYTCERTAWIEGFTLSKLDFIEYICGAIIDQARKHRRRDPVEHSRLLQERSQRRAAERQ